MVHQLVNNFIIHLVLSRFGPYLCQPVIAGLGEDDKPFICTMDSIGAKYVEFLSTASSSRIWRLVYSVRVPMALHAYQLLLIRCYACCAGSSQKILLFLALHLNHFTVLVRPCTSPTWFVLFLLYFLPYN